MHKEPSNEVEKTIVIHEVQPLTEAMLNREVAAGMTLKQFLEEKCTVLVGTIGGMYTIYETKAKEPIDLLPENRAMIESHVQSLMKSYEEDGYYFTILNLNERLKEIDGQHRFESATRKGLPTRFMIMPGWGIREVTVLNVNSRNWRLVDFMESYAKQKNPNYVRFKEFFDAHKFDITTCQLLLTGRRTHGTSAQDYFRSGEMQIDEEMIIIGTKKGRQIQQMEKFHPYGWRSRNFVEALLILFNTLDYDHEYMIEKLEKFPEISLTKSGPLRVDEYLQLLVEKYNARRQKGKIEITSRIR